MADEEIIVLMKIPGIEGNSTLVGFDPEPGETHQGWLPLEGCSFAMARKASGTEADEGELSDDAQKIPVKVEKLSIKRSSDSATADLVGWLANESEGRKKDDVIIDYVARSGRYFMRYVLDGADLVSCKLSVDEEGNVQEEFELTYDYLAIHHRRINAAGQVEVDSETMVDYEVDQLSD